MTSYTEVAGKSTTHEVYNDNVFWMTKLTGFGENYTEEWRLGGSGGFFEVFWEHAHQAFKAAGRRPFLVPRGNSLGTSTTIGLANRFELFAGAEEQLNLGFMLEISVGKKLEISAGPKPN